MREAIAGLASHQVVIGPAEDGGYYLIAMREPLRPQRLPPPPQPAAMGYGWRCQVGPARTDAQEKPTPLQLLLLLLAASFQ